MSLIAVSYPELQPTDYEFIQAFRRKHEPNYHLLEPHVTLIFPVDDLEPDRFLDHVRPIVSATATIEFTMRSVNLVKEVDDERWFLLLVPDEGFSRIVKLHDELYNGPLAPYLRQDIPFVPHITLGVFGDWERGKILRDELNSVHLEVSGRLESLQVADYQPQQLTTIADVPFARH